ncbi:MAG: GGDEF domain-containing protein [Alphaproteobacteria bacterium]|nr:GGDEF domain-containing protein [Alphaproteobacteria bacterium]
MAESGANTIGSGASGETENRRNLVRALGVDLTGLSVADRAAFEALAGEVLALRQERADLLTALQSAESLADRDTLCPVFNRRAFERELAREIAWAERYGTPLCLIFLDLDHFKQINDRFGHATGDRVLQHVAQALLDNLRQTDIVGRLGGDEFAIALTHADLEVSRAKAAVLETLIDGLSVRDSDDKASEPVQLGASCGVVAWHKGADPTWLIDHADEAMFRAKAARRSARSQ